jgi:hypothetical protein
MDDCGLKDIHSSDDVNRHQLCGRRTARTRDCGQVDDRLAAFTSPRQGVLVHDVARDEIGTRDERTSRSGIAGDVMTVRFQFTQNVCPDCTAAACDQDSHLSDLSRRIAFARLQRTARTW